MFVLHQILGRLWALRHVPPSLGGMYALGRLIAPAVLVLGTSACGQKGPLYMPPAGGAMPQSTPAQQPTPPNPAKNDKP